LSTVFGIVTTYGGGIDVWSQVGHGTTFDLYFPRADPQATTAQATERQDRIRRGSETILLVEDDTAVRDLVRNELAKIGYQVLEARNGVEACLTATQQSMHVDLLLTDVVMPGMNGRELAQHLSVTKPNLRVLFMSGYLDDISVNRGMDPHRTTFLQKPFTPDLLLRTVRALLDSSSPGSAHQPTSSNNSTLRSARAS
ncbi:MAG TPA: response regulator, partial [Nitrospira sp.]|nr:response regulator [Nitrospira sp.]